jgi:L-lactate dehydrogenase
MNVGIVGTGFVGATTAFALVMRGVGRRIVLVDHDARRAAAEADDILHGVPFSEPLDVVAGDYSDLRGAGVVIIAAGVGQKPGETRLELLSRNAQVFRDVVPSVLHHAPDAVLVIATNPVDVMTHLAAEYAIELGVPPRRVVGSGTMLDTARFRALLAQRVGVDSRHVHAYVLGEHGDSEVLTWSGIRVGGIPLEEFQQQRGFSLSNIDRQQIDEGVRRAAYRIIEGKRATYYGVASALAYMTEVILLDRRAIMTVCTPQDEVAGVRDVTVSMPHVMGGAGVIGDHHPLLLDTHEQESLHRSAALIRGVIDELQGHPRAGSKKR